MAGKELATAYVTLFPKLKTSAIESQLKGIKADGAGAAAGTSFGKGFAATLSAAAVAAAATAGAAAAVVMGKAMGEYADYEQLVGGVDTLFKESSGKLQQYADQAYRTAGLSANDYMEQSTSFAASLIQSLGGDTAKAADYANMAITDMSDNANKMGTDMMMIQNAYQGFAKQNYTMLDNLKLGYGGTQEEMKRLLEDATAISGIEYDISSYADVVDAIHVIQTEMGITGTTAAEASETISGSIASMHGAWSNWVAALGNENANMAVKTQELVDTIATVASNVIPRFGQIATALGATLMEQLPIILNDLISYVSANSVAMSTAAVEFFGTIVAALVKAAPQMLTALALALASLVVAVGNKVGEMFDRGVELATGVVDGIASWVGEFADAGKEIVQGMADGVWNAGRTLWTAVKNVCSSALDVVLSFFGIASPSKVMRRMFNFVGDGMVLGLSDKASKVVSTMAGIASSVADAATVNVATPAFAVAGATGNASYSMNRAHSEGGTTIINNYYSVGSIDCTGDEQIERSMMNIFRRLERMGLM